MAAGQTPDLQGDPNPHLSSLEPPGQGQIRTLAPRLMLGNVKESEEPPRTREVYRLGSDASRVELNPHAFHGCGSRPGELGPARLPHVPGHGGFTAKIESNGPGRDVRGIGGHSLPTHAEAE